MTIEKKKKHSKIFYIILILICKYILKTQIILNIKQCYTQIII
jgi:hypothetical protein